MHTQSQQELDHLNMSHSHNNMDNSSSINEQFIVKKAELNDVLYFMNEISTGNPFLSSFHTLFNEPDLEMLFETSFFTVTVIDHKNDDELVGLFVFNDTPFGTTRRDEYPLLKSSGIWEEWFNKYYEESKVDGKNSLWMTFFCFDEKYCLNEEVQRRIYHKVHLSLYTTLANFNYVLALIPKKIHKEIPSNLQNLSESELAKNASSISFDIMTGYMYTELKEKNDEEANKNENFDHYNNFSSENNLIVFLNNRVSVFPMIEIRLGTQEDHDDLENIFKDQTPNEVMNSFYEDFFIAKMIAAQNSENKVLVGQVNDKAIGMLALGTNIELQGLIKSFELENYDNLLKQDYMKAVKLKRRKITSMKEKSQNEEKRILLEKYKQEIMSCERISQRIYLQEYIKTCEKDIDDLDEIEKTITNKEELTAQTATDVIKKILEKFSIKYPNLEPFEKKIKVDSGSCLLTDEFNFFIETLEFFGLPKGYMQGNGHWADWLQKEAQKRAQKELFIKKLGKDNKKKANKQNKKENDEPQKPAYFDFSPLAKAMRLFKDANLRVRALFRKIVLENKHTISSFFVNEEGEPSETKCFDIMSLKKKLIQAKISYPSEFADMIGPMFLCFGNLPYQKRTVMRVPEEELVVVDKIEVKKKKKEVKKKEVREEEEVKREVKPVEMTLYEVSISDFFSAIETSFDYDRLLFELNAIYDEDFKKDHALYLNMLEENEKKNSLREKSEYQLIKEKLFEKNIQDSETQLSKYNHILSTYNNEMDIPPTPPEVINAFCVKLFFIEQAFESRSSDFLIQAFDCFPDKDYMIVTQPHSYFENSLLDNFIKIEKKLDSLFNDVLYIIHRESLMVSLLQVDYCTNDDLTNSAYLFEQVDFKTANMYYKMAHESINLLNVLNQPSSKFTCVTARIKDSNIGIFLISKEVNISYYDSHFNIRDFSNLDKISKYLQGRIVFFLVHKNFQQYSKLFIKESTRLLNKISLYYELSPDELKYPVFVPDLLMASNRKFPSFVLKKYNHNQEYFEDEKIRTKMDGEERDEFDEIESDFCLFLMTKKMFAESRIANNNRIVVVGASDTGISFIESLLSIRYLSFSYIYLIAPGGLTYHHIEDEIQNLKVSMNNYQLGELKRLMLEHRIKIINAKVIDIKPTNKFVQLEDFSVINYDYLILTLGLQDKLHVELKLQVNNELEKHFDELKKAIPPDNPKEQQLKNSLNTQMKNFKEEFNETVISVDDPYLYTKFGPLEKRMNSLKKNPKYEIILYGRSLSLIAFIQGLIKRGVPTYKIKLVIPNILEHYAVTKEEKIKARKDQGINEELNFINGNNLEDTKEVEEYLMDNLMTIGVTVLKNFNFTGVNLNETNDQLVSYRFTEDGTDNVRVVTGNIILTGGLIDVDQTVFRFIHDNRLVYNGRGIIDKNFKTADRFIFAAGRLCEFSQAYTEKFKLMRLESYNSREVGITLAKSFLQTFETQLVSDQSVSSENKIPTFFFSLPMGCYLPNDMLFFKIKSVKETNPKVLEKGINRQALIYNNLKPDCKGCYLKFTFNTFGIIDSITYLGDFKVNYNSIISLVGLHENYLNELLSRYEIKLIEDIPAFLSEDWALALFHDGFSKLVLKLKALIQDPEIEKIIQHVVNSNLSLDRNTLKNLIFNISETTKQKIEFEVMNFLMENKNHVPFYYIPK